MASYGLPADVVEEYESSVHAEALHQRGDPQAPDCSRCHGNHGAAPPGTGDVSKVCGQCHRHTRDAFRLGPHRAVVAAGGQRECAACHGKEGAPNKVFARQGVRSFKDADWQKATKDAQIEESIRNGKKGTMMAGFEKQLSDEEIKEMVAYIRKLGK